MSRSEKLLGWAVGLGTLPYVLFGALSVFAPDFLSVMLGVEWVEFSYVWVANLGMLALVWALFSFPVAGRPDQYRWQVWTFTLGHLLLAAYWGVAILSPTRHVFRLFFAVEAVLFVTHAVLLFFAPAGLKPTPANIKAELAALKQSRQGENTAWKWFRIVTWVGITTNVALFIVPALFFKGFLAAQLGAGQTMFSHVWLNVVAVILLSLTLAYVATAIGPKRNPAMPLLMALNRVAVGIFWYNVFRTPYQSAYLVNFLSDFGYGVILLVLLALAYRADRHPVWQALSGIKPLAASVLTVVAIGVLGTVAVGSEVRPAQQAGGVQGDSPLDHYKHGAIGMNPSARVPLYVWEVLPTLFPDLLPQNGRPGMEALGLLYEEGNPLPIGFARHDSGFPAVEPNCSLCHTGSYRAAVDSPQRIIPGAPAHLLDLQAMQRFLYGVAGDPRFTADNLIAAIEKNHPLSAAEKLQYRYVILPMTQSSLLKQKRDYAWQNSRPVQGPGRTDTFNPTKINVFHMPDDGTIGTVDLPQIWNQALRRNLWLHWDGNNNRLEDRNLAAAMAVGATPRSVILPSFQRVFDFALELKPAPYPFPVDRAKAAQGEAIYQQNCSSCHSFGAPKVGQVTPIEEIGTDRHRLDSFTQGLVDRFHAVEEYPFRFQAYRKTQGYTDTPIDGIWARAPYLHNGSVPTLWDLLQPPANRPKSFYTGFDVYDPVHVGYVTTGPDAERGGWKLDTTVPGNGNQGHTYGTQLTDEQKWALIEYLKTF
ncbi:MAG TPA: c-type cytochrome [Longimicrobium sp.]